MSFELTIAQTCRALRGGPGVRALLGVVAGLVVAAMPGETQNAVANGDTRTIQLYHAHTKESISVTYMVDGSYDSAALDKLNWFLRDWRRDEPTKMDPKLFDVVWEVHRESGSRQPVEVMSAYRSPETNAMLRRRSRAVAEHSQHILGKAMDQHYQDVPMSRIRELAMRLQRGGVGFYPTAGTPFVHMDVGGVRHWPRMSYDQLARLFPDGKTVHIPSNGQPLPGYEMARAELESQGGSYPTVAQVKSKGFFAWLFGSDEDEDTTEGGNSRRAPAATPSRTTRVAVADPTVAGGSAIATYDSSSKDGGARSFMLTQQDAAPKQQPTPYGRVARDAPLPSTVPPVAPTPAPVPVLAPMAVAEAEASQAAPAPRFAEAVALAPALPVPTETVMSNGITVPIPPRRPMEVADLSDLPMPPTRPAELSRSTEAPAPTPGTARSVRLAGTDPLLAGKLRLPTVITQGPDDVRPPAAVMAYAGGGVSDGRSSRPAPVDVPLPVARPADLVRARLDRANFRTLTSVAKTANSAPQAGLGAAVVGVRAASRATLGAYTGAARGATSFGSKASELGTDRFSGPAMKGQEKLVTARRAEAAKASTD